MGKAGGEISWYHHTSWDGLCFQVQASQLVFNAIRGSHILDLQGVYITSFYLYWYHVYFIEPCMLELYTLSQNVMAMLHMGMLILTMPYCWLPLAQHEIATTKDLVVCAYQEVLVEGDVNPRDEAKAMQVGIKEKSLILRQKLGKLTTVANLELGDQFLAQVIIIHSYLFKRFLNDMLLLYWCYRVQAHPWIT
jgi:hypothetical protein